MKLTFGIVIVLLLLTSLILSIDLASPAPAQEAKQIPTETTKETLRRSMHSKLAHANAMMHGLVTRDFKMIHHAAENMKRVSLEAPRHIEGDETENELYQHFRLEFLRNSSLLEKMADEKNLEGAAFAYQSMTANCLACHSYLDDGQQKSQK